MSGPSEKAVEAGAKYMVSYDRRYSWAMARAASRGVSAATHDPALGEDASVRLGDVLDLLRNHVDPDGYSYWGPGFAEVIERARAEGRL